MGLTIAKRAALEVVGTVLMIAGKSITSSNSLCRVTLTYRHTETGCLSCCTFKRGVGLKTTQGGAQLHEDIG